MFTHRGPMTMTNAKKFTKLDWGTQQRIVFSVFLTIFRLQLIEKTDTISIFFITWLH